MVRRLSLITVLMLVFWVSASGNAATLNVSGGQLLGASGVLVRGNLYDVAFLDGTCIALFSGCVEPSDFTFQTSAAAAAASQALLDQVFIDGADLFDTDPGLTNGIGPVTTSYTYTPYSIYFGSSLLTAYAYNSSGNSNDAIASGAPLPPAFDTTAARYEVYAVWSPVPEPGTGSLFALGLIAMGTRRSR